MNTIITLSKNIRLSYENKNNRRFKSIYENAEIELWHSMDYVSLEAKKWSDIYYSIYPADIESIERKINNATRSSLIALGGIIPETDVPFLQGTIKVIETNRGVKDSSEFDLILLSQDLILLETIGFNVIVSLDNDENQTKIKNGDWVKVITCDLSQGWKIERMRNVSTNQ